MERLERDYAFQRKGKKYKTRYFDSLRQLFGEIEHDKDCQVSEKALSEPNRTAGTNQVR